MSYTQIKHATTFGKKAAYLIVLFVEFYPVDLKHVSVLQTFQTLSEAAKRVKKKRKSNLIWFPNAVGANKEAMFFCFT